MLLYSSKSLLQLKVELFIDVKYSTQNNFN